MADYGTSPGGPLTLRDIMGGVGSEPSPPPQTGTGEMGGYSVDDLLPGMQKFESSGRRYAVSPKGAIGLYQIMPGTAAMFGYSPQDMFDPAKNEDVARRYLGQLLNQFNGNAYLALAAYNAGPGNVSRGILPAETQQYVHDVLGYTRNFAPARQAGTVQRVRAATSVPGGTTERPAQDPIQAEVAKMQGDIQKWKAELDAELAPPKPQEEPFNPQLIADSLRQGLFGQAAQGSSNWSAPMAQAYQRPPFLGRLFGTAPVQKIQPDPGERIS